jgi:hypothetical protein
VQKLAVVHNAKTLQMRSLPFILHSHCMFAQTAGTICTYLHLDSSKQTIVHNDAVGASSMFKPGSSIMGHANKGM